MCYSRKWPEDLGSKAKGGRMPYHTEDPELAIAQLNRTRELKRIGVVVGLIVALAVGFAAIVAMYSDEPEAAQPQRSLE